MKKKILAILLSVVLVLGAVAIFAACEPEEEPPVDGVPTEDGKITLYWTVTHDSGLTDITSYFLCGTPNNWTEGDLTYEFKRVGETNTWYVFMDPTLAAGAEYKVLIGYNGNSPVDAANQGPFWANESYGKTWAAGGANSVVPEFESGATSVNCGEIVFEGCLGDPVPVKNFDVKVSFNKGQLGDDAVVFIMGHFSSWNSQIDGPALATRDAAASTTLDVWKVHVDSMFAKDEAEYLVVVFPHGLGETIADGDIWAYYNAKMGEAIKVCDAGQNAKIAVTSLYENDYLDIANTISAGSKAKGLDLSLAVMGKDDKDVDNGLILDINATEPKTSVTLQVKFAAPVAEGLHVYLAGQMEGWTGTEMTASADRKTFTLTIDILNKDLDTVLLAKDGVQYKVVISANEFSWTDETRIDIGCAGDADGGSEVLVQQGAKNFGQKFTSAEGTLVLFDGKEVTLPAA